MYTIADGNHHTIKTGSDYFNNRQEVSYDELGMDGEPVTTNEL
ncbi:hypothetical protein [Pontibacter populi]|uniref:Uncharacterized protein n=1 Tax=Pontibacter populi TaxID=890055 RepID=A0ABV1RRE5_9BACT